MNHNIKNPIKRHIIYWIELVIAEYLRKNGYMPVNKGSAYRQYIGIDFAHEVNGNPYYDKKSQTSEKELNDK